MEEMASDLWSGLPCEIEERMLSFLSVPVLCRFRTVCKRWNSLICNPEFGALCVQNASAPNFLVAPCAEKYGNILGWRFLDLNAARWYTIKHDIEHLRLYDSRTLAMDGGLVCTYYWDPSNKDPLFETVVSNPIAKTSRRLPPSPSHPTNSRGTLRFPPVLDMVVSNATQEYKIFLMPCILGVGFWGQLFWLDIYESTTNQWRSSTKVPTVPGGHFRLWCSVILEGMLYILISLLTEFEEHWQLWSYHPAEDIWKHTGAQSETRSELLGPQLIVANNRLYLVTWVVPCDWKRSIRPTFNIIEILLVEGACTKVSTLCQRAELEVRRIFKFPEPIEFESIEMCISDDVAARVDVDIGAFGFGKCIILRSKSAGIAVEIDLVTCGWELLPKVPLEPLPCDHELCYMKPMNLILPSVLW